MISDITSESSCCGHSDEPDQFQNSESEDIDYNDDLNE